MIRLCNHHDVERMFHIINDSAAAYKNVIPAELYHVPYMSWEEFTDEIANGVIFWGFDQNGALQGIMGIQEKEDVLIIRHAYVLTAQRGKGVGKELLRHLKEHASKPMLIGTWAGATWAIAFYEKEGFTLVSDQEKDDLLRKYWNLPEQHIENFVVLRER
ncbi:GNAT family N-acetyltransferase [Paenibacillus sp. GCM10027626]|uniref:GNAT family N-acetyltransferase n=1 Tax=Paenibacillus sp. GCM10027626 TaxID=3273411 RepID=UPI003645E5DD